MKKLLAIFVAFCVWAAPAFADETDQRVVVKMPTTVRLIDFQTTKRLCGSNTPPHWCPAHLLRTANNAPEDEEFLSGREVATSTLVAELEKRERIKVIKDRIAAR